MCRFELVRDFKIILVVTTGLLFATCNNASPTLTKKPETPTIIPAPTSVRTFILTKEQAREVTVFMEFIRAFNAGNLEEALALLDEKVVGSDCDYESVKALHFNGTSGAAEWLHQRIADHDQLKVSRILNENPDPVTGSHVIGVEYARRTSYTLAKLGFPKGIKPRLGARVVFHTEPTRISIFANGPGGGDPNYCRPEN